LTGVPQGKKQYPMEKLLWCRKNLNSDIENIITCKSTDKYKYSSIGHILIDDNPSNGIKWIHYGGIFIHHVTPERTIYELEKIFNMGAKIKVNSEVVSTEDYRLVEHENMDEYIDYFTPDVKVCFIDNTFDTSIDIYSKSKIHSIVSIDYKYDPTSLNSVSIIELYINKQVYIIDCIDINEEALTQLQNIFKDCSIIKICFGLGENELRRLGSCINNVVDIQEVCLDNFDFEINSTMTLDIICSKFLNKKINKCKESEAINWNLRPITQEQIECAKCDVAILFELFNKINIFSKKNIMIPKNLSINQMENNNFSKTVKVLLSGVFLSEQSIKTLFEFIKPIHQYIHGTHLILKYNPNEYDLEELAIGEHHIIGVNGYYQDEFIQSVKCECMGSTYHIIISSAEEQNIKLPESIIEWICLTEFELCGKVGVQVTECEDLLTYLPDKIQKKITEFKENAVLEQKLKLKVNELGTRERLIVYEYAKVTGMNCESSGSEDNKKIILSIGRKPTPYGVNLDKNRQKIIVVDKYNYSLLNIINNNGKIDGKILENGQIDSIHNIYDTTHNTMYILRGLPGSGKSSISKYLSEYFEECSVFSADDYFMKNGVYSWSKDKIEQAHITCYNKVKMCANNGDPFIVVDNTNSRVNEFAQYVELGKNFGYRIIVLEIYCKNKDQCVKFSKRGIHKILIQDILKIYDRWQIYDDAIILEPYIKN
jgi:NEDD4-binding protein 2